MSGRGFMALGSAVIGVGLVLGTLIGRSHEPPRAPEPPASSVPPSPPPPVRFVGRHSTETTPVVAVRAPAVLPALAQRPVASTAIPVAPPQASPPNAGDLPVRPPPPSPRQIGPDGGVLDASVFDATPPLPEAGLIPIDAGVSFPDASPPPEPEPRAGAPDAAASPLFDAEPGKGHAVVPDREVTRSIFDDQDLENHHPTGP